MDSRRRIAADVALACVVATFLVAGAVFTASAVLGPRQPLSFAAPTASGGSPIAAAPSVPARPGSPSPTAAQATPLPAAPASASRPTHSASVVPSRTVAVADAPGAPAGDGQVLAGADIHAGDGAGGRDGN